MTLTVGRMTIPDTVHVTSFSDMGLSLEGSITQGESTYQALVAQFRGLYEAANPPYLDEPIVPLTWSKDSSMDGYYRVLGSSARIEGRMGDRGTHVPWSLELERVGGNPSIESVLVGAVRTNSHTITSTDAKGWHGPGNYVTYYYGAAAAISSRTSDTGTVGIAVPTAAALSSVAQWTITPGDYYDGAVQAKDSSGNVLVGRAGVPSQITNGLVRFEVTTPASPTTVRIAAYDGAAWDSWNTFEVEVPSGGSGGFYYGSAAASAVILRNTPELVVVRCPLSFNGVTQLPGTLDIALRRGSRMVEMVAKPFSAATLKLEATTAGSSLTGGMQASANDADGHRWVMTSPASQTLTTTNPANMVLASAATHQLGLGMIVGGSGATGENTGQKMIYQYMAAQNERQRVVQR